MKKQLVLTVAAMVSVGLFVAGCGKKVGEKAAEKLIEKAIEKETGGKAKVDISGNSVKVVTDKGEATVDYGGNVAMPKDWPADVPTYKNGTVMSSMKTPEGSQILMQSKDSADKIVESIKASMTAKGWTEETSVNIQQQKMVSFKKENRQVVVTASPDGGQTLVGMTVSAGK
jgi:hypothetical protein